MLYSMTIAPLLAIVDFVYFKRNSIALQVAAVAIIEVIIGSIFLCIFGLFQKFRSGTLSTNNQETQKLIT